MSMVFSALLAELYALIRFCAWRSPRYRAQLEQRDFIAQIRVRDADIGRWFMFPGGKVRSRAGLHPRPDVTVSNETAAQTVTLIIGQLFGRQQTEAAKNFRLQVIGPDELVYHFAQILIAAPRAGWPFGTDLGGGLKRYIGMTNGGPCFVYVAATAKVCRHRPASSNSSARPSNGLS